MNVLLLSFQISVGVVFLRQPARIHKMRFDLPLRLKDPEDRGCQF